MPRNEDKRGGFERTLNRMRKQHEEWTGHTPTDKEQRHLERQLNQVVEKRERTK